MEQYGQVVDLKGDIATVVVRRHDVCGKCGGCGVAVSGKGDSYVNAQNIVNAQVGHTVKVATNTSHVLKASFVVYIIPILALLVGIWLGQQIGAVLGLFAREELVGLGVGIAFLLISYMAVRGYDRRIAEGNPRVSVIEIVDESMDTPKDELC